ncbi:hypothetical protein [Mangrovibrevibacter kandeliae]|uniref:hypothetical protein n=1 Tax=Mangrovibrevibacter kandeliae TaxID=2968473 RepID=UPI002118AC6F|nr:MULTISPECIES: hypothetical protein [unclassified Aurantimonas]MCQ8780617.1 hypothetical protein [Aurantimonas sp. CSK15Z-1]MCW4113398.1 hypothetical protein [Aurantimonas sp. MSK8Z-1]
MQRVIETVSLRHLVVAGCVLLAALFAIGWTMRVPPAETPYVKIVGSGFMFNYRVADAYYGFTAVVMKPVRAFSTLEADFDDPAGGPPHHVSQVLTPRSNRYGVRSPPLHGIEKGKPYAVHVRLKQWGDGAILYEGRFTVASDMDDQVMPKAPLTIGPGYTRNPALEPTSGG